jgi:hypothetical protein
VQNAVGAQQALTDWDEMSRESIPADLERALMIEAGYRCAVPACRTVAPLEIEHIVDYAVVRKHEFSNMIVLCANCHGIKGSGSRKLDRKALKIIKANLAVINQRYNDTERRILEYFVEDPKIDSVLLPETPVLFGYLIKDGLIEGLSFDQGTTNALSVETGDGERHYITRGYALTDDGRRFVRTLRDNQKAV